MVEAAADWKREASEALWCFSSKDQNFLLTSYSSVFYEATDEQPGENNTMKKVFDMKET